MKQIFSLLIICLCLCSCEQENKESTDIEDTVKITKKLAKPTFKETIDSLKMRGFQLSQFVDETSNDTIVMQQYYIALLKKGDIIDQSEEELAILQEAHMAHLTKMYKLGFADISGPFGDNGDIRGITIYNVPNFEMADSLANSDPMVKAGRLKIEIHPWWAAKGFALR